MDIRRRIALCNTSSLNKVLPINVQLEDKAHNMHNRPETDSKSQQKQKQKTKTRFKHNSLTLLHNMHWYIQPKLKQSC